MQNKKNQEQNIEQYKELQTNKKFIPLIIDSLIINTQQNPSVLVSYHQKVKLERILGKTNIIVGAAGVGKTSLVYYTLRNQKITKIIPIDCSFDPKPENIVGQIVDRISEYITCQNQKLQKSMVMDQELNLKQLDKYIKSTTYRFVFLIKHAEKLVSSKKQIILYNFFEWIKTWESQKKIGLVLITRQIDFINRLEKRVKSRLNHTFTALYSPSSINPPKQMICSRISQILTKQKKSKSFKQAIDKIKSAIMDNQQLDSIMTEVQNRRAQRPPFYLQIFKLLFAFQFKGCVPKDILDTNINKIMLKLAEGFNKSLVHMPGLVDKSVIILQNSNYPEYIVMALFRSMIRNTKPSTTFKQILLQYKNMKHRLKEDGSFNFPDKIMQNAVHKLLKSRIITTSKEGKDIDFENNELWSTLSPETIEQTLMDVEKMPIFIKGLLEN